MSFPPALIRVLGAASLLLVLQGTPATGSAQSVPTLVLPQAPTSIWPVTVMGWVGLGTSLIAVIGGIIAWGRMIEKLNGYGDRLKKVEDIVSEHAGLIAAQNRTIERVLGHHEIILEKLGKAEQSAEACKEDMGEYARDLGARMDEWRRELSGKIGALRDDFHKVDRELSSKLEGVAAEVRLTRPHHPRDS